MANTGKTLREELEAEFAPLREFGVTEEELEALYEQCGWKPRRRTLIFNTKRALARTEEP
jgi:hypothetical protein